jgi:hypothetical protein
MAENNRNNEKDIYKRDYVTRAGQVGTSAANRQTGEQIRRAEETRLLEAARIQRQTAGASFAEQYQQARGNMMRQNMAGTTPGLTGGVAQQRTSEISGAQMRGLSQLSGQRAQTMRDIDYQALMAPREAFSFAQQQIGAQRDEQMFNLQMIQSRQGIIDSKMSDEDKLQALLNTGMSQTEAQGQIQEKNKGFFEKLRTGELDGFAGASTFGGAALLAGKVGADVLAASPLAAGAAGSFAKNFALTGTGKFLTGTAGKGVIAKKLAILGPIGWKIGAALLIGYGAYELYKWAKNR